MSAPPPVIRKGGEINLFWPSLGARAYFSHKARKEKKKRDAIYGRAIRDAAEEHSSELVSHWTAELHSYQWVCLVSGKLTFQRSHFIIPFRFRSMDGNRQEWAYLQRMD